jgi:hypothetical protein
LAFPGGLAAGIRWETKLSELAEAFKQAQRERVRAGFAELGLRLGSGVVDRTDPPRPWKRGDPIDPVALAKVEAGFAEYSSPLVLSESARETMRR